MADAKKVRQEMTLAVAAAETTLNKVDEFRTETHARALVGMI